MKNSLVIPVYKNEDSIPDLLEALGGVHDALGGDLQVIFVIDGSPDRSWQVLCERLAARNLSAKVALLSRNFGAFAAIRMGLQIADGECFAVMAADLQEPPELMVRFFRELEGGTTDVVIGVREKRADPILNRMASSLFWTAYRRLVVPEMPRGGVDVFACNRRVRDELLQLRESHSSLVSMLFWLGFRRKSIGYARSARRHGRSAWTMRKKVKYLLDSVFAFTDLPNRLLMSTGALGIAVSSLLGVVTIAAKVSGAINVPGYAGTILMIAFFGALNLFGLGLVGSYAWRAYENTKSRPVAIVQRLESFDHSGGSSA